MFATLILQPQYLGGFLIIHSIALLVLSLCVSLSPPLTVCVQVHMCAVYEAHVGAKGPT